MGARSLGDHSHSGQALPRMKPHGGKRAREKGPLNPAPEPRLSCEGSRELPFTGGGFRSELPSSPVTRRSGSFQSWAPNPWPPLPRRAGVNVPSPESRPAWVLWDLKAWPRKATAPCPLETPALGTQAELPGGPSSRGGGTDAPPTASTHSWLQECATLTSSPPALPGTSESHQLCSRGHRARCA